jgi:two-component system chemotaxis response regulator CheY
MPEMDGLAALAAIKEIDSEARVVMVTSAASVSNMMEARKLGASHFLIKPFVKEKVQEVLAQAAPELKAA